MTAEEMREAAASWHDAQAADWEAAKKRTDRNSELSQDEADTAIGRFEDERRRHVSNAAAIRALSIPQTTPNAAEACLADPWSAYGAVNDLWTGLDTTKTNGEVRLYLRRHLELAFAAGLAAQQQSPAVLAGDGDGEVSEGAPRETTLPSGEGNPTPTPIATGLRAWAVENQVVLTAAMVADMEFHIRAAIQAAMAEAKRGG